MAEARAALLAVVEGISQAALVRRPSSEEGGEAGDDEERWPIRDVLWHVSEQERRWQRWVEAERGGAALGDWSRERRPAHVNRLDDLTRALVEAREVTDAVLDRLVAELDDRALERPRPTPRSEWELAFAQLPGLLARHERDHLQQIERLLSAPGS